MKRLRMAQFVAENTISYKHAALTPIFSRDFASTSAPFFWLTNIMIGGSIPLFRMSTSFFLNSQSQTCLASTYWHYPHSGLLQYKQHQMWMHSTWENMSTLLKDAVLTMFRSHGQMQWRIQGGPTNTTISSACWLCAGGLKSNNNNNNNNNFAATIRTTDLNSTRTFDFNVLLCA